MKKVLFVVLSFLLCLFSFNDVVDAEEEVCSYTYRMTHVSFDESSKKIVRENHTYEFQIKYDENNYKVIMLDENGNYTPNYINGLVNFDDVLTHSAWMDAIKNKNECPYYVFLGIEGYELSDNTKIFIQDRKFGWGFVNTNWWKADYRKLQEIAICKDCIIEEIDPIFTDEIGDCASLIGPNVMIMIDKTMNYIKIIVPILVIALGTFDFVRAVLSSSEDDMKKIQKTFIRRLIIAVIIFMSPYLVNLIIQFTNDAAGFVNGGTCDIY